MILPSKVRTLYWLLATGGVRAVCHRAICRHVFRGCRPPGIACRLAGRVKRHLPGRVSGHASSCLPPLSSIHRGTSLVVYTASIGPGVLESGSAGHRTASPPAFRWPDVTAYCFTDRPSGVSSGWCPIVVDPTGDPRRRAREIKVTPPPEVARADVSLWIDADIELTVHPARLLGLLGSDIDLMTLEHPERRCIYQEARMVEFLRLDGAAVVRRQMARYRREGMPRKYGLWETSLLLRRRSSRVASFNARWQREIQRGSVRDQLSVMYALWREQPTYRLMAGGRERCPVLRYHGGRT